MLKKGRDNETVAEPVISPTRAVSSEQKTIIGKQIAIEGTIRGKEDLLVEGAVKGSIELTGHHLTVGHNGQIEADIQADNVTIMGCVNSNVNAHAKVSITKEADFSGEIHAKSISVEDGAYLKAVIELEKESQKKNVRPINLGDKAAPDTGQEQATPTTDATEVK
ncbi:MAG: polymer-forming cytoskeletal protein [Deltaproteobacteria bacterium]|nr:polymer-forming cytoskeletal protein [Deltaproteobacteria bacterium]